MPAPYRQASLQVSMSFAVWVERETQTIIAEGTLLEATMGLYHAMAAIRSSNPSNMAKMAEFRFVRWSVPAVWNAAHKDEFDGFR